MSRGALRLNEDEFRAIFKRINGAYPVTHKGVAAMLRSTVKKDSPIELIFAQQLKVLDFNMYERNYKFCKPRKFELDFAWPVLKIAVEVQGMVHRIKERYQQDTEKMFFEHLFGWRVLRVTGKDIKSGRAAAWLTTIMETKR